MSSLSKSRKRMSFTWSIRRQTPSAIIVALPACRRFLLWRGRDGILLRAKYCCHNIIPAAMQCGRGSGNEMFARPSLMGAVINRQQRGFIDLARKFASPPRLAWPSGALNGAQIAASGQQMAGKTVAQSMRRHAFIKPGSAAQAAQQSLCLARRHRRRGARGIFFPRGASRGCAAR